jgi:DNA polymerase-3 subunit gamma/tau
LIAVAIPGHAIRSRQRIAEDRLERPVAGSAQSLYRRHRPRCFADVVGQEPIVTTLRHAVERDKVHHAYLFVGSRGTGKTSMAKILAACLNCERGPTVEPCGECDSCRSIAAATSLDVIEMDAASNNSVEDIRELRESVVFAPVSGRHKVYILDEAHMLSQAAWNAFLKTLEEPPPRTVFVLATTEAAKVPATVVDRCHRFDFQRPAVEQITSVLARAAQAESIEIPSEALAAIARSATGSFRDALGTLEQLVTYSGSRIALEDVLAVLGVAGEQLLSEALDAVRRGDARGALLVLERCIESGRDASSFVRDLEARARELLIVQTLEEVPPELSLTPEIDERLREQARQMGRAETVRVLDLLGAALEAIRAGADPRTQLELALVKAAAPQTDGSTRALLARIERLEQALSGARAPVWQGEPAPVRQAEPESRDQAGGDASPGDGPQPVVASLNGPISSGHAPEASASPEHAPPEPASPEHAPPEPVPSGHAPPEPVPSGHAPPEPVPEREALTAAVALDGDLDALWPVTLESVKAEHALLGAVFAEAAPALLTNEELVLAFASTAPFLKRKAEDSANRAILIDTLRRLTGRRYRVSFELSQDLADEERQPARSDTEEEVLARLMAEFDAEELAGAEGELPEERLVQQKGD